MTRPSNVPTPRPPRRRSRRARVFVLGPLGIAALATALGAEAGIAAPLWLAALAWTALASLAGALARGFRHGDWSAFTSPDLPRDDGDLDEWASRTGRYAWLGDLEDRLRDDGRPR